MDHSAFKALLKLDGQAALNDAAALQPREVDFLTYFTALSRKYPADLARAALETAILRREAGAKFPEAERMYFTRPALEQASSAVIAAYRSERYHDFVQAVDLGCSIGGDTLALAAVTEVVGIDLDPLRLAMAQANVEALGFSEQARFVYADLEQTLPLSPDPTIGFFFDPARRTSAGRVYSVEDYRPRLSHVRGWLEHYPSMGVKISPGVDLDELKTYETEVEFISLDGELKEAVLWFGPLRSTRRRATRLPGPHTLVAESDFPQNERERRLPLTEPQEFLYEPDPAIMRAGLVEELGLQLGAAQLDPDIAYLTAGQAIETPWARAWAVEAWFPFQLKRLREELRARRVGRVTIKKRGSPLQPEELISRLRLSGDESRVIFLTHLRGKPIVILAFEFLAQGKVGF